MNNSAYEECKGNFKLRITPDEDPENPRKCMDTGTAMVCFHKMYDLGDDIGIKPEDFNGWNELEAHLIKKYKPVMILPLYLYDHSGLTIATKPFSCAWDSGQIGFIFVTTKHIKDMNGKLPRRKEVRTYLAQQYIDDAVKVYDQYLRGAVYRIEISEACSECGHDKAVDSMVGCFGYDYALQEGKEMLAHACIQASATQT